MHKSVIEPPRRERIAFLEKFGEARLERAKAGLGIVRVQKDKALSQKNANSGRTKACLDSNGHHRRERIAFLAESGQAWHGAVKQGLGAANQFVLLTK